ncbi:Cullin family protein [Diaporthe helianthi]|uniref:Anaphase-promoting complex subunit 2 n=1 Tax=Diaporthe helianthi TaxID=158607 RepID=A0A2P5HR06_DIAHE|nr:Cullin family protein [Diaporthe helianthi]
MAAQAAQSPQSHRTATRAQVFRSVFPSELSLPTSQPNVSAPLPGYNAQPASTALSPATASSLLAPLTSQTHDPGQNAGKDAIRSVEERPSFDRAWKTVTTMLQLPRPAPGQESPGVLPPESLFESHEDEIAFITALQVVLQAINPAGGNDDYSILAWHSHQARRDFIQHVEPLLEARSVTGHLRPLEDKTPYRDHVVVVENAVHVLQVALQRYFRSLTLILHGIERGHQLRASLRSPEIKVARFRQDLYALISNSAGPILPSLRVVLGSLTGKALSIPTTGEYRLEFQGSEVDNDQVDAARSQLLSLVGALAQVGLAGEAFQGLFAEVMDQKMREYVRRSYAKVWTTASANSRGLYGLDRGAEQSTSRTPASWCIVSLYHWVDSHFARLAIEVRSLTDSSGSKTKTTAPLAELQQWKEVAIGHMAALRISELFDIVLQWPASKGALDDLKASVTTPERRRQLTDSFSAALQKRLLHPARSTRDILRVYISMIRAFHALDHSKVLLGRVVPSLQLYLIQREDAVRVVVTGLLASPQEVEAAQKRTGASGNLVELAMLLNDPDQQRRVDIDDEDLDWDDLTWVPDPVDAGVNYKRPRSEDVIGTLISTLGAEDVFIKEFQAIIADNLLSTQTEFTQEQRVLDLLKKRFGESALQNCEVMIKDILDSRKVDSMIRMVELGKPAMAPRVFGTPAPTASRMDPGQQLDLEEEQQGLLPYQARILSRLYWPNIVQDTFTLPRPVTEQQARYARGYEHLKTARKLTWLDQLGQATVELELEDRTISVECKTFEAAVIYAFQGEEDEDGKREHTGPARRTVQELGEQLQMDEELVLQALEFWESKQVLGRCPHDQEAFVVLERRDQALSRPELHPAASAPAVMQDDHGPQPGGKPTSLRRAGTTSAMDAKENERRAIYWQFIVGMLTNSMPNAQLGQLAMMMRMLITDGFTWSDQDLQEFLAEKVHLGELEVVGGKYRLVKK